MINYKKLSESTGLTYIKKRLLIHGSYQGYLAMLKYERKSKLCKIIFSVKATKENSETSLSQKLTELTQTKSVRSATYNNHIICVSVSNKMSTSDVIQTMDNIVGLCREYYFVSCCSDCGNQNSVDFYSVLGSYLFLCPSCFENAKSKLSVAQQSIKDTDANYLGGIFGAIIGSLAGVAVWIIAAQLGYIVYISGFVFAVGSLWGFKKFGKKLNMGGLIISLVIAAGMLFLSEYASLGILIYTTYKDTYSISLLDAIKSVPNFLKDSKVFSNFAGDLVLGYLCYIIAAVFTAISMFKSANLKYEMKMLG